MFVIKYHAKGHQTKYFNGDRLVTSKKYALAFGELLRTKAKAVESEHCTLETIKVSPTAEMMYAGQTVKVNKIAW